MEFKTYEVRKNNIGQPLSAMLKRIFADKSWTDVKRLVTSRRIQINGNLCTDETRRLKPGEVVRIAEASLDKPPDEEQITLRYQDEHLLVVEKPAGVTTLRHAEERDWDEKRKNRQNTLDELLQKLIDRHGIARMPGRGAGAGGQQQHRKQLNKQVQRGRARIKVRAVHRLDRDTSGLMVFALSTAAEQELVRGFSKHLYTRAYLAVVHGHIDQPRTIETNFVRDRGDGLRGSLPQGQTAPDAKPAITHIKPVRRVGDYTLIECKLETGRTHQIRIHLAEIGHRLCGETTYNRPLGGETLPDNSGAPRQVLHAYRLGLTHPITGGPMNFEMKMPRDLQRWLKRLEDVNEAPAE
ncbi:MAG TPA: RluA family pseudouridine synthase [Tepidisphaeraceae bacterium]|jgi:23S rRNA pseudouridine1911/1915/1917 synthase